MLAAIFFLAISVTVGLGVVNPVLNQMDSVRSIERGAGSLYAAEGISQDVLYRLIKGMSVNTVETQNFGTASGTATSRGGTPTATSTSPAARRTSSSRAA